MPKNIFTIIKKSFPVLFLLIACLPAILPLFHSGFFTMHDDQQVVRLWELDRALAAGQFPVRWVQNLGFGYGYPLFIFYPPLIYYLGVVFHLIFQASYITSIKLVFATAFLGSATTIYYWSKKHFGILPGIVSAIFYTYVPYKAVDAYVRGSLAELFTFVWLPLVLLSVDHIAEGGNKKNTWFLVLTLSYAALIVTHTLIALPFTLLLPVYILWRFGGLLRKSSTKLIRPFTKLIVSFLVAVLLSAFFWLPSLAEKSLTLVDSILLTEKYTYSQHYVYPEQLWNSIWGYAGSTAGKLDGVSFKIGKLHLIISVITVCFSFLFLFKKTKYSKEVSITLLSALLLAISAFFTTEYSSFVWDYFQPLQYLQFPWRFLTFTALFSSFLSGAFIWFVKKQSNTLFTLITSIIVLVLLLVPNLKYFKPDKYLDVTDSHYTSDEFAKWYISKTSFEFVPKGVATRIGEHGVTELSINSDQIATSLYQLPSSPGVKVQVESDYPHLKKFLLETDGVADLTINSYNFAGWTAYLDNNKTTIKSDNPLKLITVTVPEGKHELVLKFENTPIRVVANILTTLGLFVIISVMCLDNKQKLPKLLKHVR